MYQVALLNKFSARHFLTGGDWGRENESHGHEYTVELCLEGPELNEQGFLVDLDIMERGLEKCLEQLGGRTLNEVPELAVMNPSIERLAAFICDNVVIEDGAELVSMAVKVWEDGKAWALCRRDLDQLP
jgi:6-pyruvoyltetrahydropterin/6-carboxytetrahydropterin synthase